MPRTRLHSAASGPARTAFHANRGVSREELQVELDQAKTVINKNTTDTGTVLSEQVGTVDANVTTTGTALSEQIGTVDANVTTTRTALSEQVGTVNDNVTTTRTVLSEQVGTVDTKVGAVDTNVTTTRTALSEQVRQFEDCITGDVAEVKRIAESIYSKISEQEGYYGLTEAIRGRTALTPEQQQQAFLCMFALNRAESLAIDTRRGAAQNNRTLRQIRNDRLVRNGLKTLPDVFQESVQAIHNNFPIAPEDEAKERLERFWMIQNLRRAIMAHFAAQSLAAPSSTTADDAPATQDTQS